MDQGERHCYGPDSHIVHPVRIVKPHPQHVMTYVIIDIMSALKAFPSSFKTC